MTINTSRFELVLSQKLAQVGATTSNLDLLKYSSALEKIRSGTVFVVSTFSSLPDAAVNLGKLYFVQDSEELFWSNAEYGWVSMYPGSVNKAWTWGGNACGQLGDDTQVSRSSPGTVSASVFNWCQVSAGRYINAAVKFDGTAWTWGGNTCGQLGNGCTVPRCSPGTLAGGGTTWCQIHASDTHAAGVKTDGTAWTWGRNLRGELGNNTTVDRSSPGTTEGGGTTWCQISAGQNHTAAVKTDGTAWTWGNNPFGQLGDGTVTCRSSPVTILGAITTWCQIDAGNTHTVAIKTDGAAWTWGSNQFGQLGDGTVTYRSSPGQVAGFNSNWCQISAGWQVAGTSFTSAVKKDGTAWTWGSNEFGQLGDGTVTCRSSPVSVSGGGTTWCDISSGANHTAAVKTDGTAWTWGRNTCGQLGDSTVVNKSSPVATSGVNANWCQINAGGYNTIAIQSITF